MDVWCRISLRPSINNDHNIILLVKKKIIIMYNSYINSIMTEKMLTFFCAVYNLFSEQFETTSPSWYAMGFFVLKFFVFSITIFVLK